MTVKIAIRSYMQGDEAAVIELWRKCELLRPWNNPKRDIERKLKVDPEFFLVGLINNKLVATVMGGYEGHRGSVNYLAVDPAHQRTGLGKQIMRAIETKIRALGCPKINLMVRAENLSGIQFYESLGFRKEEVVVMGKRLEEDPQY